MASRSMDDDIRNECCLRLASLGGRQHCPKDQLYLGKLLVTDPGIEVGDGRRIELTSLLTLARVDGVTARSWLVLGESGEIWSALSSLQAETTEGR
ncbi:hypothetical protein Hamer_G025664 [Homarus americanus]|uniref:Uncharacterized protein n=1 Tax=Homarus americanus TaxID=6706 RepID=A0A8J5N5M2_HOMAM|nr:hypothetical protein Hamer_G025664 [Homarus americanus]